ncbi:NUDIX domain-containing protein [Actinoallomurus liliacearum]
MTLLGQTLPGYTHESVLKGIEDGADWADPTMDPTTIDWAERQARAAIPFDVENGRPVAPVKTDIRYGRNELGHWGEALAADAVVFVFLKDGRRFRKGGRRFLRDVRRFLKSGCRFRKDVRRFLRDVRRFLMGGRRLILMVERADGHGWAVPGGFVDPGEVDRKAYREAAARELNEETGLTLPGASWTEMKPRYVPDPRASDEAWMVTVPCVADLDVDQLPSVKGQDDAKHAVWVPADSYDELVEYLDRVHSGKVFAAHVDMLRSLL